MNTNQHPYSFDADAFETGRRHGEQGRYSMTASTGPAWVYWYHEGRAATATNTNR